MWQRSLEPGKAHASDLLPQVVALLEEAGLQRDALARIYVGIGPGSYTGLRVSASLALGLQAGLASSS
ncbi:MAG: hypothetical protein R3E96_09925 [Planctomycetota bacterium]